MAKKKKKPVQVSGVVVVQNTGLKIEVPNDLRIITSFVLLEQKRWFEKEVDFIPLLLSEGDQVLDIGANFGIYTLLAAKKTGRTGRVWAFEPASTTAAYLKKSVARNQFDNVKVVQSALSNASGTAELSIAPSPELNSLGVATDGPKEAVVLMTLDECMNEFGWDKIKFVKLDAEGHEPQVLAGGKQFWKQHDPVVMYEVKHENNINLELINLFAHLGFASYRLIPGISLLVPFDENEPLDDYELNLFAVSTSKADELESKGLLSKNRIPVLDIEVDITSGANMLLRGPFSEVSDSGDKLDHIKAINLFTQAKSRNYPACQRVALMAEAAKIAEECFHTTNQVEHGSTAIRILLDNGDRGKAVAIASKLVKRLYAKLEKPTYPCLPSSARFDGVPLSEQPEVWMFSCILESFETLRSF